jgi:hypothetical protein
MHINTQLRKYLAESVHKCNIDVTPRILFYLCGFHHLDAAWLLRTNGYDALTQQIYKFCCIGRTAASHFQKPLLDMLYIARLDALLGISHSDCAYQWVWVRLL